MYCRFTRVGTEAPSCSWHRICNSACTLSGFSSGSIHGRQKGPRMQTSAVGRWFIPFIVWMNEHGKPTVGIYQEHHHSRVL